MLGIFGLRADRPGFSAVEATGPRAPRLTREDGSALFAPTLPGAAAAGLRSIIGEEELLELGWRTQGVAAAVASGEALMETLKDFMDKKAVGDVLEQIAAFLELKGENPFRIRAFRTAARAIARLQR